MKAKFLILAAVATAITFTAAGCSQSEAIPPYGDEVVGETPEEELPEIRPMRKRTHLKSKSIKDTSLSPQTM